MNLKGIAQANYFPPKKINWFFGTLLGKLKNKQKIFGWI